MRIFGLWILILDVVVAPLGAAATAPAETGAAADGGREDQEAAPDEEDHGPPVGIALAVDPEHGFGALVAVAELLVAHGVSDAGVAPDHVPGIVRLKLINLIRY